MPDKKQPTRAFGLSNLARCIAAHFKIQCSRQYILQWRQDKERRYTTPFPSPDDGNRFSLKDCFDWVEKFYLPRIEVGDENIFKQAQIAEAKTLITKEKKAARELDILEGRYIKRSQAEATAISAVQQFNQLVKAEEEKNSPARRREKLKSLLETLSTLPGEVPIEKRCVEIIAEFSRFDLELAQEITTRREGEMERLSN